MFGYHNNKSAVTIDIVGKQTRVVLLAANHQQSLL